jgi:hypothetical protein
VEWTILSTTGVRGYNDPCLDWRNRRFNEASSYFQTYAYINTCLKNGHVATNLHRLA